MARASEYLGEHHVVERFIRGIAVGADDDSFTEREPVRFQNDGKILRALEICARFTVVIENFVLRRGYAVTHHKRFRKRFAAFYYSGVLSGAESLDAFGFEHVHKPRRQRIVGRDEYEINRVFFGVSDDFFEFRSLYRHDLRYLRYAGVAGRAVQLVHERAFLQFSAYRVLPSAGAYYENFHNLSSSFLPA